MSLADDVPGCTGAEEIGSGGYGRVYRARQPAFDRTVAVKILNGRLDDADTLRRFQRECQAIGAVAGHPNIVGVHDAGGTPSGHPYIVMPYLRRGSLAQRLRRETVPWQQAVAIGIKIAGALQSAHQAGVLHRDIKPENILVSDYGEPLLADFGIAQRLGSFNSTATSAALTPAQGAPELLNGERPSAASDIYGLASTVHTLIRGEPPFARRGEESVFPMLARITTEPPPDLRPYGVPDAIARVIEYGMAKTPPGRPPTALAFGQELQRAEAAVGLPVTPLPLADEDDAAEARAAAAWPSTPGHATPPSPAGHATPQGAYPAAPYPGTPHPGTPYPGTPYPGTAPQQGGPAHPVPNHGAGGYPGTAPQPAHGHPAYGPVAPAASGYAMPGTQTPEPSWGGVPYPATGSGPAGRRSSRGMIAVGAVAVVVIVVAVGLIVHSVSGGSATAGSPDSAGSSSNSAPANDSTVTPYLLTAADLGSGWKPDSSDPSSDQAFCGSPLPIGQGGRGTVTLSRIDGTAVVSETAARRSGGGAAALLKDVRASAKDCTSWKAQEGTVSVTYGVASRSTSTIGDDSAEYLVDRSGSDATFHAVMVYVVRGDVLTIVTYVTTPRVTSAGVALAEKLARTGTDRLAAHS